MKARVVALVSGRGSNLRALVTAIDSGRCDAEIAAVVTDRADAPALDFARDRGFPTRVVPFAKGDDRVAWSATLANAASEFSPTLIVLAGFMRVLAPTFIEQFTDRIVNVHPALLPSFPGHDGPAQAIRAGVKLSGCTVHLVDTGVDTGAILAQTAVPVLPDDDAESLHARIQLAEHVLLPAVVHAIATGTIVLASPRTSLARIDALAHLTVPGLDERGA